MKIPEIFQLNSVTGAESDGAHDIDYESIIEFNLNPPEASRSDAQVLSSSNTLDNEEMSISEDHELNREGSTEEAEPGDAHSDDGGINVGPPLDNSTLAFSLNPEKYDEEGSGVDSSSQNQDVESNSQTFEIIDNANSVIFNEDLKDLEVSSLSQVSMPAKSPIDADSMTFILDSEYFGYSPQRHTAQHIATRSQAKITSKQALVDGLEGSGGEITEEGSGFELSKEGETDNEVTQSSVSLDNVNLEEPSPVTKIQSPINQEGGLSSSQHAYPIPDAMALRLDSSPHRHLAQHISKHSLAPTKTLPDDQKEGSGYELLEEKDFTMEQADESLAGGSTKDSKEDLELSFLSRGFSYDEDLPLPESDYMTFNLESEYLGSSPHPHAAQHISQQISALSDEQKEGSGVKVFEEHEQEANIEKSNKTINQESPLLPQEMIQDESFESDTMTFNSDSDVTGPVPHRHVALHISTQSQAQKKLELKSQNEHEEEGSGSKLDEILHNIEVSGDDSVEEERNATPEEKEYMVPEEESNDEKGNGKLFVEDPFPSLQKDFQSDEVSKSPNEFPVTVESEVLEFSLSPPESPQSHPDTGTDNVTVDASSNDNSADHEVFDDENVVNEADEALPALPIEMIGSAEKVSNVSEITLVKINREIDLMIQRFVDAGSFINDITKEAIKELMSDKTFVDTRVNTFKSLVDVMNMWQITQYAQLDSSVQFYKLAKKMLIREFREDVKEVLLNFTRRVPAESTKMMLKSINRKMQHKKVETLQKILTRSAMILNEFFNETKTQFSKAVTKSTNSFTNQQRRVRREALKDMFMNELLDYMRLMVDMIHIDVMNGLGKSLREFLGQLQCPVTVVNSTIVFTVLDPREELDKLHSMLSGQPLTSNITRGMERSLEQRMELRREVKVAVCVNPGQSLKEDEGNFGELRSKNAESVTGRLGSQNRGFGISGTPDVGNVTCVTIGGRNTGQPCVFPFRWEAGLVYSCLRRGRDRPWCPTSLDSELRPDPASWGYCALSCETDTALSTEEKLDNIYQEIRELRLLIEGFRGQDTPYLTSLEVKPQYLPPVESVQLLNQTESPLLYYDSVSGTWTEEEPSWPPQPSNTPSDPESPDHNKTLFEALKLNLDSSNIKWTVDLLMKMASLPLKMIRPGEFSEELTDAEIEPESSESSITESFQQDHASPNVPDYLTEDALEEDNSDSLSFTLQPLTSSVTPTTLDFKSTFSKQLRDVTTEETTSTPTSSSPVEESAIDLDSNTFTPDPIESSEDEINYSFASTNAPLYEETVIAHDSISTSTLITTEPSLMLNLDPSQNISNACSNQGSCQGKCGGQSEDCFCDENCGEKGDCCCDHSEVCPEVEDDDHLQLQDLRVDDDDDDPLQPEDLLVDDADDDPLQPEDLLLDDADDDPLQPEDLLVDEDADESGDSSTVQPGDLVFTLPHETSSVTSVPSHASEDETPVEDSESLALEDGEENQTPTLHPDLVFTPSSSTESSQPPPSVSPAPAPLRRRCATLGGPAPHSGCVFPFMFSGAMFTSCTTRRRGRPWCSTQVDESLNFIPGAYHHGVLNVFFITNIPFFFPRQMGLL